MNKKYKNIFIFICFVIALSFVFSDYAKESAKINEFKSNQTKVSNYIYTSRDRVLNSVVTLPDRDQLVGIKNKIGNYITDDKKMGQVTLDDKFLQTIFINGTYEKKDPRVDAVIPMYISSDSHGGSMYIALFNDRGDQAVEKSYARLGGRDVVIENIKLIKNEAANLTVDDTEYKADIVYNLEGRKDGYNMYVKIPKEAIIPVVDGHFDPTHLVTR